LVENVVKVDPEGPPSIVGAASSPTVGAPAPRWQPPQVLATKRTRKLSTWLWPAFALVATAGLGWYFGAPRVLGPIVLAAPVSRVDFVQTLVASGHIEAPYRVSIGSQVTGVVAGVPVAEGAVVRAGDVLVTLDDTEARAAVVQAEGQLAEAEARIRQIIALTLPSAEQSLIQANATLLDAQKTYDRAATLAAGGNATLASLDDARKSLDVAKTQMRSAELQVFTNRPRGSDYVLAETQVAQTTAVVAAAKSRLSYTILKAPRNGVLIARSVEVGNIAQPGKELMSLSPEGNVQVVVQIDERNLGLIAIGQNALASADAYAKQVFPARIAYINPGVGLQTASVEVKLDVPDLPAYIREDMTISVDIEVARHPKALVVPVIDVHDANGARPWILKASGGYARRETVTVGLLSAGKAEILSGLAEGESVIPASADVRDGGRIRLRTPPSVTL
jgi:HlyD family secretion protein